MGPVSEPEWQSDQRAVLEPGPVVVADVGETQQLPKHEPGVGGPFANAAVHNGRRSRVESKVGLVQLPQLGNRFEGAVIANRLRPREILRPRDVAALLGLLLGQVRGRRQLPDELLGGSHVDRPAPATPSSPFTRMPPFAGLARSPAALPTGRPWVSPRPPSSHFSRPPSI